jgi:serine/threonine protein kinase
VRAISDERRRKIREVLPRLRLGEVLGSGAGGWVIAADDEASGVPVAVKVMADGPLLAPFARERLRTEAEVLTKCRHPNLVEVISFHEREDMLLLVMERLHGMTVLQRQQGSRLAMPEVCDILLAVARALHCVHQHGFLHGDVKPENVLFDAEDRHRLVDFGLARRWPFRRMRHVVGTPGYMPREAIVAGGVLLPATDVYALGVMAYELLADHSPFVSDGKPTGAPKMHVQTVPIPLMATAHGLPRALADLVMAAMEPDIEDRPSAAQFADTLTSIVELDESSAHPEGHRGRQALDIVSPDE